MDAKRKWHAAIVKQIAIQEMWSLNLRDAVIKSRTGGLRPEQVCDDTACSFGMWLASEEAKLAISSHAEFTKIDTLHKDFHAFAAELLRLVTCGDTQRATAMLEPTGQYTLASTTLANALEDLIR